MRFYKRDGSARHIEANKSTPQWKGRQRSAIVLVLLFVLCFACVSVSVRTCVPARKLLCVFVCASKVSSPQRSGPRHTAAIVASLCFTMP